MPNPLFSVTPRIIGDRNGLTVTTSRVAQLSMLFARFRRVRIEMTDRTVSIDDRSWWARRSSRVILFDEVAAVTYGYQEHWTSRGTWARDPIEEFVVGLKLKWGEETPLFWFVGDGTFRNDGWLPDWYYWKEYAFDVSGTQERESRMFAKALMKMMNVPLEASTLTVE